MNSPPPSPLAAADRIVPLDVVRGLAVLGILVMNVVEFAHPFRAYANPAGGGGTEGADLWAWLTQATLFDGKMRALFSMLFGAGLVLITQRMERAGRGGESADLLLRRCLWLVPFGIAHRFLLQWSGDILYMYGLLGLIAIAFRRARARTQIWLGIGFLTAFLPIEGWKYVQAAELRADAAEGTALAEAGQEVPAELEQARTRWERRIAAPAPDADAAEIEQMRSGWPTIFAHRWAYHHQFQSAYLYLYFVWDVLGMMLLGMGLMQIGFFSGALATRTYVAFLVAGAAAAALCFWQAWAWKQTGFSGAALELRAVEQATYAYTRGIVGLAWAAALILVLRAHLLRRVTTALAAVGRMAFTNYVLQTVLCTLLFFGYGFGLYGSLSRAELMLVWTGCSLVQVAFSILWLRHFRFGPLEWAWRALTYGAQPLRERAAPI